MKRLWLLGASLLVTLSAVAQIPSVHRDFLVRVERQKETDESACVIVYQDGGLHAEHTHRKRTDVYETELDPSHIAQLSEIVDSADFKAIDHPHSAGALRIREWDIVSIDVGRATGSQQIRFDDRDARKPFDRPIDPLLKWFADTQKVAAKSITNVPANRCLPDDNPPPTPSPWANAKLPGESHGQNWTNIRDLYLLWNHASFGWPYDKKECLIVHENGAFFYQTQKRTHSKQSEEVQAAKGQLSGEELLALKAELERPELANSSNVDPLGNKIAHETEVTSLLAKREGFYQFLDFKTERAVAGLAYGEGSGRAEIGHDGKKETGKLRDWIKQNIGQRPLEKLDNPSGECW